MPLTFLRRAPALPGLLLALAATLACPPARAVDEKDLLPVDQAFALTATAPARDRIALHWDIAPGYYLYRHRIGVQADAAFAAAPLQLPPGHPKHDEFFGDVETYRDALDAVQAGAPGPGVDTVQLTVKYQGCADAGVCYPPQTRTVNVTLPRAGTGGAFPLGRPRTGGPLLGTAGPGASEALPLPPEEAFTIEAIAGDADTLLLRFTPAPGYYLYRDKTRLRITPPGIALDAPRWPPGTPHRDEHFGQVVVYFDQVDVPVPMRRPPGPPTRATLEVGFQGCQTDGICYPPMTRRFAVDLPAKPTAAVATAPAAGADGTAAGAAVAAVPDTAAGTLDRSETVPSPRVTDTAATAAASEPEAEDTRLAAGLAGRHWVWTLLGFFGAGLLLAFTPCVLPMIPILSGLIAGRGERIGARHAFWLSLVYVLASALVFTAAGVVAGLVGANLQAAFQAPWMIVAFSALFVVLALSMFGLYELQLPAALRARLGALSDRQHGGSWAGVAAMGALSALIVGPCVAPPLAAAVLYIGQARDPVLGGAALFLLAMGMGAPLLAFGVAAGRGLPTSGPWMVGVERVFGFTFLGLAIWMLSRLLPAPATLALWGLLALGAASWALTLATGPRARLAARFAALVLGVVGAAQLLGALAGGRDPLQPLAALSAHPARELQFGRIKSAQDLERALEAARAAGRPVLLDFSADWCVSCKEMETHTFADPAVQAALGRFVLLQADVTANDATDQALMRRFGIVGPPATLFFADGTERRGLRLVGFEPAERFLQRTAQVR